MAVGHGAQRVPFRLEMLSTNLHLGNLIRVKEGQQLMDMLDA